MLLLAQKYVKAAIVFNDVEYQISVTFSPNFKQDIFQSFLDSIMVKDENKWTYYREKHAHYKLTEAENDNFCNIFIIFNNIHFEMLFFRYPETPEIILLLKKFA